MKEKTAIDKSYTSPATHSVVDEVADYEYAGFWIRVGASLIDTLIMLLLFVPLLFLFVGTENLESPEPLGFGGIVINYLLPAIFVVLFWIYKSATPGKIILSLRIVSTKGDEKMSLAQMIIRYIGYYPSMLVLFIGFIWIAFDAKKQGWHDKLAGTVVLRNR